MIAATWRRAEIMTDTAGYQPAIGIQQPFSGHDFANRAAQLLQGKRFAQDEIHAARRLAKSQKVFRKSRGHDDALLWPELFDAGDELVAFHFRHEIVRDDQVKRAGLEEGQCRHAVLGGLDLVPVMFEHHLNGLADGGFIIHHQNLVTGFI